MRTNWEEKKLSEVCVFIGKGKRNASFGSDAGAYKFIPSALIEKKCNVADYDAESIVLGDGGCANIHYLNEPFSASNHTYVLQNTQKRPIKLKYIYYNLCFNVELINKGFTGAALKNVSKRYLEHLPVILPPLPEQERIVRILDDIFEKLEQLKKNVGQSLQDAKELFESELNKAFTENVEGWEEKRLNEVCEIISGTTPDTKNSLYWNGNKYWITPLEIKEDNIYIKDTARKITELAVEKNSLRKMPKGTVIFSSRAPIGKIAINELDELYCNQGFKNFICSNILNNVFLYYFLKKSKNYLISLGKGTTFKEVSKQIIGNVLIKHPSLPEQQRIVEHLDQLQEQVKQLEADYTKQMKILDELKQSILQKAFKGEL